MYKVTLSMPIYNVAPYVERALLSALNQTFDSIEFLIVDDKGTDNSMEIVRKIVAEHPREKDVRIIEHPHNIGTGAARNSAIDNAQGEYLFFMDSDDEVTPDCIKVLYKAMLEDPVDYVGGSFNTISLNGKVKQGYYEKNIKIEGANELAFYVYKERKKIHVPIWNKLYNVDFLRANKLKCNPKHLNEDCIFFLNMTFICNSCRLLKDVTYSYYERVLSTEYKRSKSFSIKNSNEFIELNREAELLWNKYKRNPIYCYFLSYWISAICNALFLILDATLIPEKDKRIIVQKLSLENMSFIRVLIDVPFGLKNIFYLLCIKSPYIIKVYMINFIKILNSIKQKK